MLLGKRSNDITGKKFGSLLAIKPSHKKTNTLYWLFKCDCGNDHIARGNIVVHASKKGDAELPSCGCIEMKRKTKHGYRTARNTHPAYMAYRGIMNRCYVKSDVGYKWYGGIGVTICDEWKDNPKAFCKWAISNGWKKGLHIDKDILCEMNGIRPHVYSPDTCQWVTAKENVGFATNRDNYGKHPNVKLSHDCVAEIVYKYFSGKNTNISSLAREYNVGPSAVSNIIRKAKSSVTS